jgi:hypothetical protein
MVDDNLLNYASGFRNLLKKYPKIKVTEFVKEKFGQFMLDNPLIDDYDGDGDITIKDFQIVMNWINQGYSEDVNTYNKQRDVAPEARKLPNFKNTKIQDHTDSEEYTEYSSDWNNDGDVDELDRDILASYLLQGKPNSVDEYNLNRLNYPKATDLPNLITSNYTCPGGDCCDDDYDEDGALSSKDALIHYAFTSLIDWDSKPKDMFPIDYYNQVAPDGFKFYPKHLPTVGCGDFEENGTIDSSDSLIYYAWSSLTEWDKKNEEETKVDYFYKNALPGFKFLQKHSPVCPNDSEIDCNGFKSDCIGDADNVDWKDFLIFYKWLIEGKCETVDCYNCVREEYPEACRLPIDIYHNIGANKVKFEDTYSGVENL